MSQKASPYLPSAPPRPYLLDYLLLLVGFSLSLYLMDLSPLAVEPADQVAQPALRAWVVFLPRLMRLPEGVILFFPVFFVLQKILLRRQAITSGEWLWMIAWLGTAGLTCIAAFRQLVGLPDWLDSLWTVVRWVWYFGFGAALAATALLLALYGVVRRAPMPWTHTLSLALMLWPIPPLVGILLLTKK
jgi:hypothetical protein